MANSSIGFFTGNLIFNIWWKIEKFNLEHWNLMSNLGWERETRDFYKTKCYEKEVSKVSKEMNLKSGKEGMLKILEGWLKN